MKLRFCESEIPYWSERYSDPDGEELENELTDKDLVNKGATATIYDARYIEKGCQMEIPASRWSY